MRLLITRPQSDADRTAGKLNEIGVETVIEPVMKISLLDLTDAVPADAQALLCTSRNAIESLAKTNLDRTKPLFVVGRSSAELAVSAGFSTVFHADGTAHDLAELVGKKLHPADGPLFYARGADISVDLAKILGDQGFELRAGTVYQAKPSDYLSEACRDHLSDGQLDGVLFYSPRSAEIFGRLVNAAGLEHVTKKMAAYCLSGAVASAAKRLEWRNIMVAQMPTEVSLLRLVEQQAYEISAQRDG